jgi:hypothetical protein
MPVLNIESLDDTLLHDLCADFSGGQSSFQRPDVLEANQAAYIKNCHIHFNGQLRKRRGMENLEEGYVDSVGKRIQGGWFYQTTTEERLLVVSNGLIYEYVESLGTWELFINASINDINEQVDLVQLSDDLYWTDTAEDGIRRWEWATETITTQPTTTPNAVENASILVSFTNRLIVAGIPSIPDGIAFSDFLDGTQFDTTNVIRVGADGDPIIALKPWQDHFLLVFKEKSTWVIDINPVTPVAQVEIKLIHSTIGCCAKRSICQVGQDVFFLSRNGVMSVQKQIATSNNVIPIPVSFALSDVIDTINWEFAYKSAAVFYKNIYMLMVPVNENEPNTGLVYSYLQQAWAGVWDGIKATFLMEQPFLGSTRLIAGTDQGEVKTSRDRLGDSEDLPETFIDGYGSLTLPVTLDAAFPAGQEIESELITRGLFFGEAFNPKLAWYLEAEFQAKESDLEIYAILDGGEPILLDAFSFGPRTMVLPAELPFTLQVARWVHKKYPLFHLGRFRSIQIQILCPRGNMIMRSLYLCAFLDTIELDQQIQIL